MARIGGNPELENHQFTTDKDEPCTAQMNIRVPPSQLEKLKNIKDWQEKVRGKIAEILAES
jgi:hypothetical protein